MNTYSEISQLIAAAKVILGKEYDGDIQDMFHNLEYAGLPKLAEEPYYHYTYQLCASKKAIPVNKQPGVVYLYVDNGILHYLALSKNNPQHVPKEGTLKANMDISLLKKEEDLAPIKQQLDQQLIDGKCFEPSYEAKFATVTLKAYNEILKEEKSMLAFAVELRDILRDEQFKKIFASEPGIIQLIKNILDLAEKIKLNQETIIKHLEAEKELNNSSQLIDNLKNAYGAETNLNLYPEMTALLASLDVKMQNECYIKKVSLFYRETEKKMKEQGKNDSDIIKSTAYCISLQSFTVRFAAQLLLRRTMTLSAGFSGCFKKGHARFHELEPVFIAINRSAKAANLAMDVALEEEKKTSHINARGAHNIQSRIKNDSDNRDLKQLSYDLLLMVLILYSLEIQPVSNNKNNPAIFISIQIELLNHLIAFEKQISHKPENDPLRDKVAAVINTIKSAGSLQQLSTIIKEIRELVSSLPQKPVSMKIECQPATKLSEIEDNWSLEDTDSSPESEYFRASYKSASGNVELFYEESSGIIPELNINSLVAQQDPEQENGNSASDLSYKEENIPTQQELNNLKNRLVAKHHGFFSIKATINKEAAIQLCQYNDFNGFYNLALAARTGTSGIPKDPVAAYYLAYLAQKVATGPYALQKINTLLKNIPEPGDKKCHPQFPLIGGFSPKDLYMRCLSKETKDNAFLPFPAETNLRLER